MFCKVCSGAIITADHESSEKHLKNQVLYEYSINRKQLASNRHGAVVTCNVKTSIASVLDCADARIKISTKPDEEVKFDFIISNENRKSIISVNYIEIPQNSLNFTMNDHCAGFGCSPILLKAKRIFPKEIFVLFKSPDMGQYEMPIIFSFSKKGKKENIVIVREMVVYVEQKEAIHQTVISPYTMVEVNATKLIKSTFPGDRGRCDYYFRIPKNCKPIYASGLVSKKDSSEEVQSLTADIKDIFSIGVTKDNYIRFFHHLLWYEETIVRINLKKYNMAGVALMSQVSDCLGLFVPGLGEKRPSLLLGDLIYIKPVKTDEVMFEGVICDINENHVIIRGLDERFWKHHSSAARYDIRFSMSRLPLERMHTAVNCVLSEGQGSRVFPVENKKVVKLQTIKNYYNLQVQENREQCLAVQHIVSGSSGTAPYLLHGPPGTGKTVTVVEAILQLVKTKPQNQIMVCTDSNMAADHVATMLIKYAHFFDKDYFLLRANSKYRVWETLPECLYHYSNGISYHTFAPVSIKEFIEYRIVVTTLSHAAKFARQFKTMGKKPPISHLFVDEAAQASEPACLIPCMLLRPLGQLVLAGDPLQLGPVCISHRVKALGLGLSLMERLKTTCPLYSDSRRNPRYVVMLRNNFRSHQDILHIPNNLFYKGQLKAFAPEDNLSNVDILGKKPTSRAIVFHGVLSKEQKMGKSPSFYNDMEVEIVQMYVKLLIDKHNVLPEDIGIVAPYIRQVYKIKSWLHKNALNRVEVGTVEAFQGKEKRVILVSTVRASCSLLQHDAKFQLGFLVDDKRFNVALTRAKAKAIVIGNPLCLEKDAKWLTYMQQCKDYGTYCGFDFASMHSDVTQKEMLKRITPLLQDLKVNETAAKIKSRD